MLLFRAVLECYSHMASYWSSLVDPCVAVAPWFATARGRQCLHPIIAVCTAKICRFTPRFVSFGNSCSCASPPQTSTTLRMTCCFIVSRYALAYHVVLQRFWKRREPPHSALCILHLKSRLTSPPQKRYEKIFKKHLTKRGRCGILVKHFALQLKRTWRKCLRRI